MRDENKFPDEVEKSAKELMNARKGKNTLWHYAYVLGVGGWLLVIPIVGGAYFGKYLDKKMAEGYGISWTVTFIIIGIAAGIYNVWHFLLRGRSNEKS